MSAAARMLRLPTLVPGPDMTAAYGAVLTATDLFEAEDVMEELVDAGLLQATFTGRRYQMHGLLRRFARAWLAREESGERTRPKSGRVPGCWRPPWPPPGCSAPVPGRRSPPGRAWSPWTPPSGP
ncbi:hypothetical protein ACFY8K_18965 [Streptomyces misionensis]|uniref:hypothetical protein n=1 Tax=Streptomyces misionensis TaxID=67331 RepID=UPI0036A493A3